MTEIRGLSSSPRALRRFGVVVGIACTALTSTGCQDKDGTGSHPTPSQPRVEAHADSTQSPSAAEIEAVRRAYQEFVAMLDRAASLPAATRREQLSRHMMEPQLSKVLQTIETHEANDISTYGSTVVHIKSIRVNANEAKVRDCQDSRKSGLIDTSLNKKVNRGIQHEKIEATLRKSTDGRWRVNKSVSHGEGC